MYCIQFGDTSIHTKSRLVVVVACFRFLKRMVPCGHSIHIFQYSYVN